MLMATYASTFRVHSESQPVTSDEEMEMPEIDLSYTETKEGTSLVTRSLMLIGLRIHTVIQCM